MATKTLLALIGCTALASSAAMMSPRKDVKALIESLEAHQSSEGQHGFKVRAIHTLHKTDTDIIHTRHPVAMTSIKAPPTTTFEGFETRRDMIRALWQLNMVAYNETYMYKERSMTEIIENRDSVFGEDIASYSDEQYATEKMISEARTNLVTIGSDWTVENGGFDWGNLDDWHPKSGAYGVHAIEWSKSGFGTVLCFRGARNFGDHGNAKLWLTEWIKSKMTATMAKQWTTVGLEDLKTTEINDDEAQEKWASDSAEWFRTFKSKMMDFAARDGRVAEDDVAQTGSWEFAKVMVDSVYEEFVKSSDSDDGPTQLVFTGHSLGGTWAALASMYLKYSRNTTVDAITFGATGGACFPRKLDITGSTNMLYDVDPRQAQNQITDYVHPLDIYGHLGVKVGRRCTFGVTGIKYSRAANYCKDAFSHTGATLMTDGYNTSTDLYYQFQQCRYCTGSSAATNAFLMDDDLIDAYGATDGGCIEPDSDDEVCAPETGLIQQSPRHFLGEMSAAVIAPHV